MSQQIITAALILSFPLTASAAVRTFHDHKGNEVKAELTGVRDGMVVLKDRGTRRLYPLAAFSLEDREFVIDWLNDKKQPEAIRDLMSYAKKNTRIRRQGEPDGDAPSDLYASRFGGRAQPGNGDPFDRGSGRSPNKSSAVKIEQADVDMNLKEMYGLSLPTDELMAVGSTRTWTDLAGETLVASFDQVIEPGLAVLRVSPVQTQQVPMVNLVRDDIVHIQEAIKADLESPIFPEGVAIERPTTYDRSLGLRVWRDRRNQELVGRYKSRTDKDVTLEVAGVDQVYPFRGLSKPDRLWIELEDKRRAEGRSYYNPGQPIGGNAGNDALGASGAAGAAGAAESNQNGNQRPAGGGSGIPSDPASSTQATSLPVYQFHCDKCGHTWTREGVQVDNCPRCAANGGSDSEGSSSYRTGKMIGKLFGLLMSLCGIGWGINKVRS